MHVTQSGNASLAVAQVAAAMAVLPPQAIVAFNVGNEPDLYPKLHSFPKNYSSFGYFTDVTKFHSALKPILMQYFGTTKMIAGGAHVDDSSKQDNEMPQIPANNVPHLVYAVRHTPAAAAIHTFNVHASHLRTGTVMDRQRLDASGGTAVRRPRLGQRPIHQRLDSPLLRWNIR